MYVLFYAPSRNQAGNRLKETLDEIFPQGGVETHRLLSGLMMALRSLSADLEVVVLMPGSLLELSELYPVFDELLDVRLVLVLPDEKAETIAMAHRLRPRFITYADGDYAALRQVLQKILAKTQ